MMSIVLHHYKVLKEKKFDKSFSSSDFDDENNKDIENSNNNIITLKREIEKWNNFSSVLRKQNRELFNEML